MSFDPITAALDIGGKIIDKVWPDKTERDKARLALLDLQQQGEFKALEADLQIALAQAATNTEEARRGQKWRPFIGYVCGCALAYNFILHPLIEWASAFWFPGTAPPTLDISSLYPLVLGLLGLGGFRTYEKVKGAAK